MLSPRTHKENDGDRLPQRLQNGELIAPSPVSSVKWTKLPWGTAHPFYNKDTIRVGITEKELNYIRQNGINLGSSDLLKIIHSDPIAVPIFHRRHIETTDRLKTLQKAAMKAVHYPKRQKTIDDLLSVASDETDETSSFDIDDLTDSLTDSDSD